MSSDGAVPIQGCACRITRLAADGSVVHSTSAMIVDDKPFVKFTAKPAIQAGVEIVPISACGAPLISFKDYDRVKRWDVTLDLGDLDFDKREIMTGGALLTSPSSSGRTFADGITTSGSTVLGSASLSAFTILDVGRVVSGTGIFAGSYIVSVTDATHAVMSSAATATGSALSITLAALTTNTIGYQPAALLSVDSPNGVSVEIWSKAILRGTGYQPSFGRPSAGTPTQPGSAWFRWGWFRCYLFPADINIEGKELPDMYTGWAIENPNFGTGPADDWRTTGDTTGVALDTTKAYGVLRDPAIPGTLRAGYQAIS